MLTAMRPAHEIKGHVDAVILTIRDDEKDAVDKRVGSFEQYVGRRTYRVARLAAAGRTLTVALYRLPEQGNSPAQAAATDAIEDLDPTLIVLVGIAGAVPAAEFTLGDVLVATRIADLRIQALVPDRLPELSVRTDRIQAALADRISNLIEPPGWAASIVHPRPVVTLTPDMFTADQAWNKKARESLEAHFHAPRLARYQTAEIAATDFLVKDAVTVQHWLQAVRKIEGFEMEAAGVMGAATRTDALYPVLVVRGISDIVGYKRDPEWTAYACHSAAAFAIALLRSGQLEGIGPLRAQPSTEGRRGTQNGPLQAVVRMPLEGDARGDLVLDLDATRDAGPRTLTAVDRAARTAQPASRRVSGRRGLLWIALGLIAAAGLTAAVLRHPGGRQDGDALPLENGRIHVTVSGTARSLRVECKDGNPRPCRPVHQIALDQLFDCPDAPRDECCLHANNASKCKSMKECEREKCTLTISQ
jgi:nucleoside phosphorylase